MIFCIGLSHQTTPLVLRERFSLDARQVSELLERFVNHLEPALMDVCELAVLSTCNRVEFYACLPETASTDTLVDALCEPGHFSRTELAPYLQRYAGSEAVAHLCRVAAGLESSVLGEPQILGQVTEAYQAALAVGALGQSLGAAFQTAIRAGKRVHTETGISRHPATVSSAAIRLAEECIGPLAMHNALVVGTGEMGALAVKALLARGVQNVRVMNRTPQAALELAERWGCTALPFEQLSSALSWANLVIVCTAAPQPVISAPMVQNATRACEGRPLVLIDIALPRNVGGDVAGIPGVRVLNLDDLTAQMQVGLNERAGAIPQAERIVAQEAAAFDAWQREEEARELIATLHRKAEIIRQRELQRTLRYLPDLNPQVQAHIQHLTQSLMDKLLHMPTQRLRAEAGSARLPVYAATMRELFDLEEPRAEGHPEAGPCH
jgi:glutamyl-tRNA reductase